MALSDEQVMQMLLDECITTSDENVIGRARRLLPSWWEFYAKKSQNLRYWYVRRSLCMFLQAQARFWVDTQTGPDKVSANQFVKNATTMVAQAQSEIDKLDPIRDVVPLGQMTPTGSLPDSLQEALDYFKRAGVVYDDRLNSGRLAEEWIF